MKKLLKCLYALVNIHLRVQLTEVARSLSGLPAFRVLALAHAHHVRFVLPEVESLSRMYLASHALVEVFVGNLSVLVTVEPLKDVLELLLR